MKAFIVLFALVAAAYADAEAEADPYLLYGAHAGYHGFGLGGLGYAGLGYAGLPYGAAYGYSAHPYGLTAAVKGVQHIPGKVEVKTIAPAVVAAPVVAAAPTAFTYHHGLGLGLGLHGLGLAGAVGAPVAHVIAKRDAEAEADPAYFYNGYRGYAGFGYGGYGLGAYGAYGLGAYGAYGAYAGFGRGAYGAYGLGAYGAHGLGVYGAGLALAPADPTNPQLVHTSRLGVCVNYLGAQVPC